MRRASTSSSSTTRRSWASSRRRGDMNVRERTRTSLRLRILLTTLGVLALALAIAVVAFERVAHEVVTDAVHAHLVARAKEVQESVVRFQRERMLTVSGWAEAEAM